MTCQEFMLTWSRPWRAWFEMAKCGSFRRVISVLRGDVGDYLPEDEVLTEKSDGNVKLVRVRVGDSDATIMWRGTGAVTEIIVKQDLANASITALIERIGLKHIADIMVKRGYVPKSLTLSYVIPSKALYLLIEGVRGRVPTVRVSVRGDSYEASASYCVISEGENVCDYLDELIAVLSELRECVIAYTQ